MTHTIPPPRPQTYIDFLKGRLDTFAAAAKFEPARMDALTAEIAETTRRGLETIAAMTDEQRATLDAEPEWLLGERVADALRGR